MKTKIRMRPVRRLPRRSPGPNGNQTAATRDGHAATRAPVSTTAGRPARQERVRLELIRLEAERKDNFGNRLLGRANVRWDVYLVFCMEHPDDPAKSVVWTFPDRPIDMTKGNENVIALGTGGTGATVLECDMPDDRRITLTCRLMQSKDKTQRTGDVLRRLSRFVAKEVAPLATKSAVKSGNAHAAIAVEAGKVINGAVGVVGQLLGDAEDKERGFGSLEYAFPRAPGRQRRPMRIDLGQAKLLAVWSTDFV
jgi:hypothetical protein